jgi:hypothetical protein
MGVRKPFSFGGTKKSAPSTGSDFDPSNPWGDVGSTNVTPQAPKKSFDPIKDRELKTQDRESMDIRSRANKAKERQRSASNSTPVMDSGSNYRNDLD